MQLKTTTEGWLLLVLTPQTDQRCIRNQGLVFFTKTREIAVRSAQTLAQTHGTYSTHVMWGKFGKG